LSGVVPQIYAVCGVCSGGASFIASSGDVVIIEETNGKLFVNSPFLLKTMDKAPANTGSADSALHSGLAALSAKGEDGVFSLVKQVIGFLPSNSLEGISFTPGTDDPDRLTFNVRSHVLSDDYNIKSIITDMADNGVFLELYTSYGPSIVCGFATVGGINVGVVANQPCVDAGAITDKAARKAAKFISLCDAFSLPVVTLVDTCGMAFSAAAEQSPLAAEAAKLAFAYASATTPKVTLVCGKAYGTGFAVMGSKALGADLALALPCAEISILPPETAVDILYGDTITSAENRAELMEQWAQVASSAVEAAKGGHIDDVIELPEVRQRIASALQMLSGKRETRLPKKHGNLPI
jgi:acetyl-CoA carboxylase carboxyltransferase component